MGCYVNPKGIKKDAWLKTNGRFICDVNEYSDIPVYEGLCHDNRLPVVLVDNGSFYAAAVCYNRDEYNRFVMLPDPRPRMIYTVEKGLLMGVVDIPDYIS